MRNSVFLILLATASLPASAIAQDRDGRGFGLRGARAEQSENRSSESSQRSQRSERRAESRAQRSEGDRAPRAERSQRGIQSGERAFNRSSGDYSGRRNRSADQSQNQAAPVVVRDSTESVTNWRSRERRVTRSADNPATTRTSSGFGLRGDRSPTNWGDRTRDRDGATTVSRSGSWRDRDRDNHGRRWSNQWRNDRRYNWRNHRNRYSSLYRLGRYYDPFGYGYRRFSIGLTLGSGYYGQNHWLNDPWQYRLPPAYGPYRWVRYYDDALLVNIYSGQVVDVIHSFFW